jgi:hypothetical protein
MHLPHDLMILLLRIWKHRSTKAEQRHSGFIHISQILETTQTSIHWLVTGQLFLCYIFAVDCFLAEQKEDLFIHTPIYRNYTNIILSKRN